MTSGYDIIGDIHGHGSALEALLQQLGYTYFDGRYQHPHRQVVFLGDFIDRGPEQAKVLDLARPMVESGNALAIMGNHELNALAYHTEHPDQPGAYLRPRSEKNTHQHRAFLEQLSDGQQREALEWFEQLPLWLELDGLRLVHAAWDPCSMNKLSERLTVDNRLDEGALPAVSCAGTSEKDAIDKLLKGIEVALPDGHSFEDKDGHTRKHARIRWWKDPGESTWPEMFMGPPGIAEQLPKKPVGENAAPAYPASEPPVFFGHYWFRGTPEPLAENVACLDYSVAGGDGGKLAAYRWSGERKLRTEHFTWVDNP